MWPGAERSSIRSCNVPQAHLVDDPGRPYCMPLLSAISPKAKKYAEAGKPEKKTR